MYLKFDSRYPHSFAIWPCFDMGNKMIGIFRLLRVSFLTSVLTGLLPGMVFAQGENWIYAGVPFGGSFGDAEIEKFAESFFLAVRDSKAVPDAPASADSVYLALGVKVFDGISLNEPYLPPAETTARRSMAQITFDQNACNIKDVSFEGGAKITVVAADIKKIGISGVKQCFLFGVAHGAGQRDLIQNSVPIEQQVLDLINRVTAND